ncbi:MAG TPA: LysR family transcriptional regulator [Allosphingosinicella sp.]|uniref:LysR family transcriptional regulator n=1 Tax=Allosphingosinicella sp. TaxID=2823234 RepID=UPI002ED78702
MPMMLPARLYPSLSMLRAADASARLGGFTAAAEELNISQSAVSQAVRQLEAQLGITLFERTSGGIRPTGQGRRYLEAIRPALDIIAAAGESISEPRQRRIVLGCVRSLLHNWLLPRLPGFAETKRTYELSVIGLCRGLEEARNCDVALILAERGDQPEAAVEVAREVLVPVCLPLIASSLGGDLEEASSRLPPLLGSGWDAWSRAAGLADPLKPAGIRFRDTSASLEAARAGQGIVLAPEIICRDDLAHGRLAKVSAVSAERGRAYWLVGKGDALPLVSAFREWLQPLVEDVGS